MTDTTTLDLDAIRKRLDNATPGPWGVGNGTHIVRGLEVTGRGSFTCIQSVAEIDDEDDRLDWCRTEAVETDPEADAAFIAHARQDIPALLAEVDRLRAELEQARRKVCVAVTCEECSEAFRQDDVICHFTSLDEARSIVPDDDWVFVGDQAYCGMCRHETHAFVASGDGDICQRCDLEEDDHQPTPADAAEAVTR